MKQLKSFRGFIALFLSALILATVFLPVGVFGATEQNLTVNIANQMSGQVENYQALIGFDTATQIAAGNMNADCSDLLVRDSDQTTKLYYFIETGTCNRANTQIWVKIPVLPASPSIKTVYFNFGTGTNNSSYNNPENVFDFYDTFNTNQLGTKWGINMGSSTFTTVQNAQIEIDTANSQALVKGGGWGAMTTMSSATTPRKYSRTAAYGLVGEARMKATNYNGYAAGMVYYDPNITLDYNKYSYHSYSSVSTDASKSGQLIRYGMPSSYAVYGPAKAYSIPVNNWYIHRLIIGNTSESIVRASLVDENSGAELSYADLKTAKSDADFSYNTRAFGIDRFDTGTTYMDWFRVRKYLSQAPVVSVQYNTGGGGTCDAVAFGYETVAQSFCSFVVGRFNEISGNSTTWVETDTLFVIGNGSADGNRKNAVTVLKNGNMGIGTAAPSEKMVLNGNLKIQGNILSDGDICIGKCN